jgi:hypothetical protein
MPIISGGPQQTLKDVEAGATKEKPTLAPPLPGQPEHIGVVFVHGIGSQKPGETLLDWSQPLIQLLTDWRTRHGHPPDPVVASRIDFSGGDLPVIDLDVPALDPVADHPAQTWHVTEAWWASNVRPPTLLTMASWLATDMGRVIQAIQDAARHRSRDADPGEDEAAGWIRFIDWLQSFATAAIVGVLWFAGLALGLPYAILRSLPLIGDKVAIAQLDSFLVDWFGDLRILLDDPAQAANIRSRLAEALTSLRDTYGCTSIVIVAHSGGAIVSLTTLSDPIYALASGPGAFPVTRLVTIGQGMGLGWNLSNAWRQPLPAGDRLLRSAFTMYPDLQWLDFWGTYDPAPAGKFKAPTGDPTSEPWAAAPGPGPHDQSAAESERLTPNHSWPVWNRMSLREDHGTYWDNEEQFVVRLLREVDTSPGEKRSSRFFRDDDLRRAAVRRRIERVATLGWWRMLAGLSAFVAILWAFLDTSSGGSSNRLADIGAKTSEEFAKLPGHEAGSGSLDAATNIAHQIGAIPYLGPGLALIGQLVIGLLIVLAVAGIPGWFGIWRRTAKRADHRARELVKRARPTVRETGSATDKNVAPRPRLPSWLPFRTSLVLAVYGIVAGALTIGSWLSLGWAITARHWLEGWVGSIWSAQAGNVLFGTIVVAVLFTAIYALGAAAWGAWDARERSIARTPDQRPDRRLAALVAVLLLVLLLGALWLVAILGV